MDTRIRLLLVEDDPQLGPALLRTLNENGYATHWAKSVAEADLTLATERFEAVVLDLGLPDGSGLSVLRRMRKRDDRTPVLILTARDAVEDRVKGLDEGGDDYLAKPFAVPELLSRLRALVRRSAGFASRAWQIRNVLVDPDSRQVAVDGQPVELSPREFQVLMALARSAGRVLTRGQLEDSLAEVGYEAESNALEVHIHHLRKKLGQGLIRTVRGVGYLLEAE